MRSLSAIILLLILIQGFSQDRVVVVVELFTSEGCSSCPPADRLLSSIITNSDREVEIMGLSFHVDYWDYIGWRDPYARKDYTIRQRAYGRKFQNNSIYTPQMIVNGKYEFVGSDQRKLNQVLSLEKNTKLESNLELSDVMLKGSKLSVSVSSSDIERSLINIAVVERGLSQNVKRGENRGLRLYHDNVVRAFYSRQFDGKTNRFNIDLPTDLIPENASLIIYAQKEKVWHVNAAKKIDLKNLK